MPQHSVTLALVARAHGGRTRIDDARDPRARHRWLNQQADRAARPASLPSPFDGGRAGVGGDSAGGSWIIGAFDRRRFHPHPNPSPIKGGRAQSAPVPAFLRSNPLLFLTFIRKPPPP